ncbi:adaptin ear-binding coat-associated protein 2 [Cryptococcus neoformans Bt1]|nr:adaptin ear-binding coat-associated protein 2 [Cryptococcus neoformans var. grubii Bt1]
MLTRSSIHSFDHTPHTVGDRSHRYRRLQSWKRGAEG